MICDFAQYYHVLDWRGLPLNTAAALAFGLPEDSRCKIKLSGQKISVETALAAQAVDYLALLWWSKTKAAQTNTDRPKSLFNALTAAKEENDIKTFNSPDEYENYVKSLRGGD